MDVKKSKSLLTPAIAEIATKKTEADQTEEEEFAQEVARINWLHHALYKSVVHQEPRKLSIANIFGARLVQPQSRDSFHRAIYPILLTAQIFALMPVAGIGAPSPTALKFKWSNTRTIYCVLFTLFAIMALCIELVRASNEEISAKSLSE